MTYRKLFKLTIVILGISLFHLGCASLSENRYQRIISYDTGLKIIITPNPVTEEPTYEYINLIKENKYRWNYNISITNITDFPLKLLEYGVLKNGELATMDKKIRKISRIKKIYPLPDGVIQPGQTVTSKDRAHYWVSETKGINIDSVYYFIAVDESGKNYKGEANLIIQYKE